MLANGVNFENQNKTDHKITIYSKITWNQGNFDFRLTDCSFKNPFGLSNQDQPHPGSSCPIEILKMILVKVFNKHHENST